LLLHLSRKHCFRTPLADEESFVSAITVFIFSTQVRFDNRRNDGYFPVRLISLGLRLKTVINKKKVVYEKNKNNRNHFK
jgi:hypothetical protein